MKYNITFKTKNGDELFNKTINSDFNLMIGDYISNQYLKDENLMQEYDFNSTFIINMRCLEEDGEMNIWVNADC